MIQSFSLFRIRIKSLFRVFLITILCVNTFYIQVFVSGDEVSTNTILHQHETSKTTEISPRLRKGNRIVTRKEENYFTVVKDTATKRSLQNLYPPTILALELYNTVTQTKIRDLVNGTTITLNSSTTNGNNGLSATIGNFNIRAVTSWINPDVSVRFSWNTVVSFRTDSWSPYSLCGDIFGQPYFACGTNYTLGIQTIVATPYARPFGLGNPGTPFLVRFSIVVGTAPNKPPVPVAPKPVHVAVPVKLPTPTVPVPKITPVQIPVKAPVHVPTVTNSVPKAVPVPLPIVKPTIPVPTPMSTVPVLKPAPIPVSSCKIPNLVGFWETYPGSPVNVAESQGAMLGNELVLFSGFSGVWTFATPKVMSYNVQNRTWTEKDNIPIGAGVTHTGHVVVDRTKFYMCGGFVGGAPYYVTNECYVYNHRNPKGSQWRALPKLPNNRTGGGMIHDISRNTLIYMTGASRSNHLDPNTTLDSAQVWELSLVNETGGWKWRTRTPYAANHVGYTSVMYQGKQRHYILGGQLRADEANGNLQYLYEYDAATTNWIRRADMLFPRGHFSSSVVPDRSNCGFFIIGGATNGGKKTSDISYYSIAYNNWTKVGDMQSARNTPVCGISQDNYLYCQGGNLLAKFSWRIKLS